MAVVEVTWWRISGSVYSLHGITLYESERERESTSGVREEEDYKMRRINHCQPFAKAFEYLSFFFAQTFPPYVFLVLALVDCRRISFFFSNH